MDKKLEQLRKNVVDAYAAYAAADDAYAVYAAADDEAYTDADYIAAYAAYIAARPAWDKARLELEDYLKEQDNE